ncbi:MAG: cell division protein FtsL [Spirochaetales bacterium]|nr:cell division protein FtsL [Spirochaetales bacterium]
MRKILTALVILSLPLFLLLNVWQSFTYQQLESDIVDMEARQKKLLEENKRFIIAIEYLRAPARIEMIAEEQLEMQRIKPGEKLFIRVSAENNDG